jgi:class 3 adenylate cyclase
MKNIIVAALFLLFSALPFSLFAQNELITGLEKELAELEGIPYCETAILLSDLYFEKKDFAKAAEYAKSAYQTADQIGRKDYMATALNKQAKANLKNKQLKKGERLASLKQLAKSLELMTTYEIDNVELESDNIESLINVGKEFIGEIEKSDVEELLVVTLDSIKHDLAKMPKSTIRIGKPEEETSNRPVPEHILHKRQQQLDYQQKIMVMNLEKVENEMKKTKVVSQPAEETVAAIEDFAFFPKLREQWIPQKEELEKAFEKEAQRIKKMDELEAREELLLAEYKYKYDSLSYIHSVDSINLEKKEIALRQQEAEAARQKIQQSLMMVGSGGSVILSLLFLFGFIQQRKNNRLLQQKNGEIQHEQERSQELLLNILPAEVANELKEYGAAKAHRYDEVTVLFSDFQNFSGIAEKLSPEKLIQELDYCFKAFDRIIEKNKLEKIKTIGDAYLCAGGVPSPHSDHAIRTVNAALEMQQFLEKWKKEKKEKGEVFFEARIGIHTGPIIAGVVGVKKFAYDIWGDTVNIASRMESSGQVGKVNISENTYQLVKNQFNFEERGKMAIKNKGEINMYFVENELA